MAEEKKTSQKAEKAKTEKAKSDKPKKKSKKNPFKSIASFFKSVKAEGKKVVWANGKDVLKNTVIVLVVVIIAGLAIYGVDTVLSLGMKGLKNLADTNTTTTAAVSDTVEDEATDESADTATEAETTTAAE